MIFIFKNMCELWSIHEENSLLILIMLNSLIPKLNQKELKYFDI